MIVRIFRETIRVIEKRDGKWLSPMGSSGVEKIVISPECDSQEEMERMAAGVVALAAKIKGVTAEDFVLPDGETL